ncbi:MAG: ribose 5-phosphate isomerase A [Sulfolobaceae archaeon]
MGDPKEFLADYVIDFIKDKKIIGLGTGSTIKRIIEILANKIELKDKIFISSSLDTELLLSELQLHSISLSQGFVADIYVDSFDVFNGNVLIKGGGGALFREKLLAENSHERVFVGDKSKFKIMKSYVIPLEVEIVSAKYVVNKLKNRGYKVFLRSVEKGKYGPIISDNGNVIMDIEVQDNQNLCELHYELKRIVGVIETGIFCKEYYDYIVLADNDGKLEIFKKG